MKSISKQLDENLTQLAWSLWTELGVAGLKRNHQTFAVSPEELIILTSVISEFDPRLRDEALDWCVQYHRFISPLRLQILAKKYQQYLKESFSTFTTTLNSVADIRTKWIVLTKATPLKFRPSNKSHIRSFDTPAMIHFRLRSLFGVGARADVLAFLLNDKRQEFSVSDLTETGYSKRRVAEILEDLARAGILSESQVRNQLRYAFARKDLFNKLLGDSPKRMIHWYRILDILLPIHACVHEVEETPLGVRAIDMRNLLNKMASQLMHFRLIPPPLQKNLEVYWSTVIQWILDFTELLAKGELK